MSAKRGLTDEARRDVRIYFDALMEAMHTEHPALTDGEIYDAFAQELERCCRVVIDRRERGS